MIRSTGNLTAITAQYLQYLITRVVFHHKDTIMLPVTGVDAMLLVTGVVTD